MGGGVAVEAEQPCYEVCEARLLAAVGFREPIIYGQDWAAGVGQGGINQSRAVLR